MTPLLKEIEALAAKGLLADRATIDQIFTDILTKVRAAVIKETHDILIYWGNKANYNRHKVAIEVQDAVNLRALAREFVKVVDQAMDENKSTKETWDDAAVVLFVNKFESLCRSEARFSAAYKVCQERAGT